MSRAVVESYATAGLFGEMCFRTSSNNALTNNTVLRMSTDGMKLQKVVAGVVAVLDSEASATATANTWYRVRILAKGSNVTVWRGEGDDGPMEEVLSSSAVPTLTTVSMWFLSGANAAFAYDDVAIVANGWTSDTTFATNSGNELTSSTFGGVTTTYGYDAWGNMTNKARGSYTATYAWHYGGKLTGVTSDFPSEGTVAYAYGGDGKRRERDDGNMTKYRWENKETLLNEEDSNGVVTRTNISSLASISGASPATGDYSYFSRDIRQTSRRTHLNTSASLATYETTPYGSVFADVGPRQSEGYAGHTWDSTASLLFSSPYSPATNRGVSPSPSRGSNGRNAYNLSIYPWPQPQPTDFPPSEISCKEKVKQLVAGMARPIQNAMGIAGEDQVKATDVRVKTMLGYGGVSFRRNSIWIGKENCEKMASEKNGLHCIVAHELAHAFSDFWRSMYFLNRWILDTPVTDAAINILFLPFAVLHYIHTSGEEWVTLGSVRNEIHTAWRGIEFDADKVMRKVYPNCVEQYKNVQ